MKLLSTSGSASGTIYANKDYEIQANLASPYINGVLVEGQVFKIPLPTTDATFDFGGIDWANYFFEVYTPAKSVGSGLDVYYEFGERYMVGDAGLPTRFHQGMTQNQTPNLSQPALFELIQGDNYFARRTLNVGNEIKYSFDPVHIISSSNFYSGLTLLSGFDVQDYIIQDEESLSISVVPPAQAPAIIKVVNNSYTFAFTGQVTIRMNHVDGNVLDNFNIELFAYNNSGTVSSGSVIGTVAGPTTDGQILVINLSGTITRDSTNDGLIGIFYGWDFTPPTFPTLDFQVISGYLNVNQVGNTYTVNLINPNFSFFYESAVNSNGRPWVVNPDGKQNYNMVLFRYGQAYQQDTNINNINRFFYSQLDEYARSKGDIRRLKFRQRILRVFQSAGCGQVGVYGQFITNSQGATQLIYTSQIITQNNIQYYLGEHGMGAQNTSLISNKNSDMFIDPVTGEQIRLSNDGMISVSKKYKGQYYIGNLFLPYNFTWQRPDGSNAKILGVYDHYDEQWVYVLQSGSRTNYANPVSVIFGGIFEGTFMLFLGGNPQTGDVLSVILYSTTTNATYTYTEQINDDLEAMALGIVAAINDGGIFNAVLEDDGRITTDAVNGFASINYADTISIEDYAFSFNEPRNAYCSFYDFNTAESLVAAENIIISFKNGQLYKHDNTTAYANFYGTQYRPTITLDFNAAEAIKKTYISMAYQANGVWEADRIQTQVDTYGATPQASHLVPANFKLQEGWRNSSFMRDENSPGGWVNGWSLKGGYLVVKLTAPNDGGFYFLNMVEVKSIESPLNNR
jgi:hypothetical protein